MIAIDVAIIGAGISGLAVAHTLRARGRSVLVLERQVRPGGNAISERIGGFLMEHGPSSVNAGAAEIGRLSSRLGLDDRRVELGSDVRRRYLTSGGRLNGISTRPFGFLLSNHLSVRARGRLAAEVLFPRGHPEEEETVAAFSCRRFGSEFADKVMDPLVGGMFAGDAGRLAVAHVFPALVGMEREYGSVIRAVIHKRLRSGTMPARRLYSWRDGIGELPRALAAQLGTSVRTGVSVHRIVRSGSGFRLHTGPHGTIRAAAVVVATQPHAAAQLLEGVSPRACEAAAAIEAPPIAIVYLGYRRRQVAHALDGLGYLTPSTERRNLTGALFCSTMFEGRAPQGHVALAGYVGGCRAPHLAESCSKDLVALARAEFSDLLGAEGEPVVARVRRWVRGLPQYNLGHGALVAALDAVSEETPGLHVTGNYLRGMSVAACIEQAVRTAIRIDGFLPACAGDAESVPGGLDMAV